MEYVIAAMFAGSWTLFFIEFSKLKKKLKTQQAQMDALCSKTGYPELASNYLHPDVRAELLCLKGSGKEVEAVKKLREVTGMDLVDAKIYLDSLL